MSSQKKAEKSEVTRPILGASVSIKRLVEMIEKVAPTKTNVLVIGESGTGKELIARMIHELSFLKGKPFVPVNCGAIPETLIESEMFGHRKGSFTGAVNEKQGLFEVAHGGTLFLDEVGELPLSMQVKLLRAIQERSFRKVGGTEDIKVDVRIVAATNRDLEVGVAKGTFREDLYYRLNVIQLKSPALRDRVGDIRVLAEAFLKKFSMRAGRPVSTISAEALSALESWSWPGNVRELENVIERGVTLELSEGLTVASLPPPLVTHWERFNHGDQGISQGEPKANEVRSAGEEVQIDLPSADFRNGGIRGVDLKKVILSVERFYYAAAKEATAANDSEIAKLLGLNAREYKALQKRIEE